MSTMLEIERCTRSYGIGSNPMGGRYVSAQGVRVWERLTQHCGRYPPIDGGLNPKWTKLRERLGCSPFEASDEALAAAIHTLTD